MNVSSGLGYGCPLLEEPRALNWVAYIVSVLRNFLIRFGILFLSVLFHEVTS